MVMIALALSVQHFIVSQRRDGWNIWWTGHRRPAKQIILDAQGRASQQIGSVASDLCFSSTQKVIEFLLEAKIDQVLGFHVRYVSY